MYLQIDMSVQVILANRSFMKPKNSHFMNINSPCYIPVHVGDMLLIRHKTPHNQSMNIYKV